MREDRAVLPHFLLFLRNAESSSANLRAFVEMPLRRVKPLYVQDSMLLYSRKCFFSFWFSPSTSSVISASSTLEGNDAIRVIDPDHTGVLRRSFRFHFFSPLHIRFMIFIKACRLLPDRRQTSQLRRFSPRAAHSAQTPSSAAAVDQNARSG